MQILEKIKNKIWKRSAVPPALQNPVEILVVSDTHGCLNEDDFEKYIRDYPNIELCLFLGDHVDNDIEKVINSLGRNVPYAGVLGNHDYILSESSAKLLGYENYLEKYDILNLNGNMMEINGVMLTGMQGCFKYKEDRCAAFTEEESVEFCKSLPPCNIFVSHDRPCEDNGYGAHYGLPGMEDYLKRIRPQYHIHGHVHEDYIKQKPYGTVEISTFMYKVYHLK